MKISMPANTLKRQRQKVNSMETSKNNKASLTVGGFYGARNKRKWLGIERSLDNAVKRHKEDKIPKAFKSRILGPSTKWETFYRQQDAFSYARSTAKDLHVFAFESETFVGDSGQRMYLVASYPVFWHYYSQLQEDKRHHYEIIPEGAVCKLYFDLEYDRTLNPGRDGDKMMETLIKYVCLCLRQEFKILVSRDDILDLQASTDKKFSRHLIFLFKKAAFKNNIHAGKFVCHTMSQLLEHVKNNTQHQGQESVNIEQTVNDNYLESERKPTDSIVSTNADEFVTHPEKSAEIDSDQIDPNNVNTFESVEDAKAEKTNVVPSHDACQRAKVPDYSDIMSELPEEDLQSLVVKNKHGEDILFCDSGVYTKNRNFRLFMSSKLGKRNPLTVSNQNQYNSKKGDNHDEQIFYDSLVANVQYCEKIKILSYDYESPEYLRTGSSHRSSQDRKASTIEGYSKSPYPEVDDFVAGLITQNGARGVIRHWTYFQQGELLVYEITRYRFCHNINREHRSNNIMYIADLRRGIYYQKCHDPDCQIQSFKSQDWSLPKEVLPAHYFDELSDDMDLEIEDDDFLNTTAEMERQYFLNQSKDSAKDLSLAMEDGEDEDLLNALEEAESTEDG